MAFTQPRKNNIGNTLFINDNQLDLKGTLTVGVDDTGHDVKLFGATSGAYMLWDESEDSLILRRGKIQVNNSSDVNKFNVNTNGNTTIGGTLDVNGSTLTVAGTNPQIKIGDDGAEDTSLVFMGNAQDFYIALDDTTDDLTIGTGTTIGSNVKMVIENGGNVGIGTTTPNQKLTVEGTISLKEQADANSDTAAYGQLWVNTATPNELYFTTDAGNDIQLTSGTSIAGGGGAVSAVANGADNRIATFSSSDALNGEANLTFDGCLFSVQDGDISLQANSADANDLQLIFQKSRHATAGSHTVVQDNDKLGSLEWYGSDGTDYAPAASIFSRVNGTPGNNGMQKVLWRA